MLFWVMLPLCGWPILASTSLVDVFRYGKREPTGDRNFDAIDKIKVNMMELIRGRMYKRVACEIGGRRLNRM